MSTREEYIRTLQAKLAKWNAEIEALTTAVRSDVKVEYFEQIESLKAKHATARQKLDELQHAGEGAWEDLKSGIELAWTAMGEAIDSARSRLK